MKRPEEHIASIFKEYTTPSRVLRTFTNLSNTVIQTALSGQSKFIFEILQNADDAFEDPLKLIEVKFILEDNYFIINHNGKGFDYNDVERICDYASQIEEVKATDLSKTGYKGLGFKALFNLSDCIYIHSNGYSFRFDKAYWPDAESIPWQVIPIWCKYQELPLNQKYSYDQSVNFIMKIKNVRELEGQLRELLDQPELLLYLHRINKLNVNLNEKTQFLERKIEKFGVFDKVEFYKDKTVESTWLSRAYERPVPQEVQKYVRGSSRFIFPEKIKKAENVLFSFALRTDQTLEKISKVTGLCYSTLPTQLYLSLPYHINCLFILNLDRTQFHENEWNEFLMYQLGYLQLNLLKDLAEVKYLKNYTINFYVRKICHSYNNFCRAFLKGFQERKGEIRWLPDQQGLRFLKLGEAWIDETEFFKQNFDEIRDDGIYPYLINYDVQGQNLLDSSEANRFTYDQLFRDFRSKYYPQLTANAYINFINYLYNKFKDSYLYSDVMTKLKNLSFLTAKDKTLLPPNNALLEENTNPIPRFLLLNPIDNDYLPTNSAHEIKEWLVRLGAVRLTTQIQILRNSILEWIDSGEFNRKISRHNHIGIINYLANGIQYFTNNETVKLREKLLILTESNEFKQAKLCYFMDESSVKELTIFYSDDKKVSSLYDLNKLRRFFIHVGVNNLESPIDVFRTSILMWIKNGEINSKLTKSNYEPLIELIALHYPNLEQYLTCSEKSELKKIPVLTCDEVFQKAQCCYFDTAVPSVKGLESIISENKLVSTNNLSKNVYELLKTLGVSEKIASADMIRKSLLKWIQEGEITNRITHDNYFGILKYISEQWESFKWELNQEEIKNLKRMPVLTESGAFREACNCYWSISNSTIKIPEIESIVFSEELVSKCYLDEVKFFLNDLGVHDITFTDIYEKYSDHLTLQENVKWFFSELLFYWDTHKKEKKDEILRFLQQKLRTSCLLAKNGKCYSSTELYSSHFENIHDIDKNSIPLLDYELLPKDLEQFLGFKTSLDFECIKKLLQAIDKKIELGKEKTLIFFSTLLNELRLKDKNEIKENDLSLLSAANKIKPVKDLYYFIEKDATCYFDSCYLKRISDMTHDDTLELAELCGVNTLPFELEIKQENGTCDDTLKEFFLERLSFIVFQESRKLNEDVNVTLKRLHEAISAIKLYKCESVYVRYPFSDYLKIPYHFDYPSFYIAGKWTSKSFKIYDYLSKKLRLETDISDIFCMELPHDKENWLSYQEEREKFDFVEGEVKKLLSV